MQAPFRFIRLQKPNLHAKPTWWLGLQLKTHPCPTIVCSFPKTATMSMLQLRTKKRNEHRGSISKRVATAQPRVLRIRAETQTLFFFLTALRLLGVLAVALVT